MKKAQKKKTNICIELFWEFLKIGLFTIGGGMAMIPQLQQVIADEKKWLKEDEMIDCIAISQALPGVIAINAATYIGMKLNGIKGSLAATFGVILPSFTIIIAAVTVLESIGSNPYVEGAFTGIKAAVCGLILVTVVRMGKKILRSIFAWILAILAFAAVVVFEVNVVWIILAAAVAGVVSSTAMQSGKCALQDAPEGKEDCALHDAPESKEDCALHDAPEGEKDCALHDAPEAKEADE